NAASATQLDSSWDATPEQPSNAASATQLDSSWDATPEQPPSAASDVQLDSSWEVAEKHPASEWRVPPEQGQNTPPFKNMDSRGNNLDANLHQEWIVAETSGQSEESCLSSYPASERDAEACPFVPGAIPNTLVDEVQPDLSVDVRNTLFTSGKKIYSLPARDTPDSKPAAGGPPGEPIAQRETEETFATATTWDSSTEEPAAPTEPEELVVVRKDLGFSESGNDLLFSGGVKLMHAHDATIDFGFDDEPRRAEPPFSSEPSADAAAPSSSAADPAFAVDTLPTADLADTPAAPDTHNTSMVAAEKKSP
ncbi:MAG: hypothetical protein HQL64_08715, partial [Magnetococcales bacterium]|nr:hypothetical protein [Magnetococcales bacterium]